MDENTIRFQDKDWGLVCLVPSVIEAICYNCPRSRIGVEIVSTNGTIYVPCNSDDIDMFEDLKGSPFVTKNNIKIVDGEYKR